MLLEELKCVNTQHVQGNETNPNLRLLAVTVLTSINQEQLNQLNIKKRPKTGC